jgi:hypothetical protein
LNPLAKTTFGPPPRGVPISTALGHHYDGRALLDGAFQQRDVRMTFIRTDARWNNLRPHPRFHALMKQMRFTAGDAHGIL